MYFNYTRSQSPSELTINELHEARHGHIWNQMRSANCVHGISMNGICTICAETDRLAKEGETRCTCGCKKRAHARIGRCCACKCEGFVAERLVSSCCGATADDFMQEMKRCSDCKESCEYVTEGFVEGGQA